MAVNGLLKQPETVLPALQLQASRVHGQFVRLLTSGKAGYRLGQEEAEKTVPLFIGGIKERVFWPIVLNPKYEKKSKEEIHDLISWWVSRCFGVSTGDCPTDLLSSFD